MGYETSTAAELSMDSISLPCFVLSAPGTWSNLVTEGRLRRGRNRTTAKGRVLVWYLDIGVGC